MSCRVQTCLIITMRVLGYIITCGYVTSENSSRPFSRQYSVVLNEVQENAGLNYESKLLFGKRGTVGDMICVLMEMKCTKNINTWKKCAIPKINRSEL